MSLTELSRRTEDLDTARRLGQALWMLIGTRLELSDLIWSRAALGADGDRLLWDSLVECQALGPDNILHPAGLCRFLCEICGRHPPVEITRSRLIWTLPAELGRPDEEDSYYRAALDVISAAKESLWLVSPFLEARGVGRLIESLLLALSRRVAVNIIAHNVGCLGAAASVALEDLRREAISKPGKLTVYAVDETARLLVHSKIIVADTSIVVLGSANLTANGLGVNLEAGVYMRDAVAATQVLQMLALLLGSSLVHKAFSPRSA